MVQTTIQTKIKVCIFSSKKLYDYLFLKHYSKVDRTAGDASSSSPGTSGSHPHAHSRHLYHQHTSSSQETDLGNDSTGSSNSNQVIHNFWPKKKIREIEFLFLYFAISRNFKDM